MGASSLDHGGIVGREAGHTDSPARHACASAAVAGHRRHHEGMASRARRSSRLVRTSPRRGVRVASRSTSASTLSSVAGRHAGPPGESCGLWRGAILGVEESAMGEAIGDARLQLRRVMS
jgi:hypothetical protein